MANEEVVRKLVHTTKELRVLKTINKAVHSTDNLDVLVTKVLRIINKELRVSLVFIALENKGQIEIKGSLKDNLHPEFEELLKVISEDTIKNASPIFLKQTRPNTKLRNFRIRSLISAPLMSYSGPIGTMIIMAQYRNFHVITLKILNAIAVQTASAIQHARLKQTVDEKEKKIVKLYSKLYGKEAKRAIVDELTSLYNKRYFITMLEKEIEKRKRVNLIILDLDFFKSYNDTYGHVEGDKLLANLGKTLQKKAKKAKACRYGGEEFAILVSSSFEDAVKLAESIRKEIESFYPDKAKRTITASFGVGQRKRREKREQFVKRVDAALYKAKEMGRNTVWTA
ncbi:MAG: sensor domain-containing diguanylate cyclase [Candidatus Pacearchaeota archaeon]|nr:MAG: sensor domain-containing diguanylate cyclase [Candidatus Pacearchaeota archaeon]